MTKKITQQTALVAIVCALLWMVHGCAGQSGPASQTAEQAKMVAIDAISATDGADQTSVTITADGPVTFSSFKKPDPPAVVLILPATDVERIPANPEVASDLIKNVTVSSGNGGRTARIEFQLASDAPYTASQQGNEILLTFNRSTPVDTTAAMEPVPAGQELDTMATDPTAMAAGRETAPVTPSETAPREATAAPAVTVPATTAWVNKVGR